MGEKERGALEEGERQTQQSSFGDRAARPREAGSQREGGGISHEDDWGNQKAAGGKPTKDQVAMDREAGDGEGVPDAEGGISKSRSNVCNNPVAATGGGAADEGGGSPEAMASNLNLSKSNINRLGGHNDAGDEPGLAIGDQGAVEPEHRPRPK